MKNIIQLKKMEGLRKKLISISTLFLFAGMILFSACENIASGADGASVGKSGLTSRSIFGVGDPIPIANAAQLALIGTDPDDYPSDGDYILTASFPLVDWTPICDPGETEPFTGTFDGNGETITIRSFSDAALDSDYLGIFAASAAGVTPATLIQNLNVEFTNDPIYTDTALYFGGVVANATATRFNNIIISGDLAVYHTGTSATNFYAGGVTGYATSSTSSNVSIINSIHVNASMPAAVSPAQANNVYLGGIAGYANGGGIATSASHSVIGARSDNTAAYAGGLLGYGADIAITNGVNTGEIISYGPGYSTSGGGIAAYITHSTVTNSYSTAPVSVTARSVDFGWDDSWQVYAGGLVGYSGGTSAGPSVITKCHAEGDILLWSEAPFPYAGGLVGYNYGYNDFTNPPSNGSRILQSYATGIVYAYSQPDTTTAPNFGDIPYAGGLVGYSSVTGSLIENCYATGKVYAETIGEYAWAGGIIGGNAQDSVVSKCYATGDVNVLTSSFLPLYAPEDAKPGPAGGGIAGYNYYGTTTAGTVVEDCAALNSSIYGTKTGSESIFMLHRVVGDLGVADPSVTPPVTQGTLSNNIANRGMLIYPTITVIPGPNLVDGDDTAAEPDQTDYENILHWNFSTIWTMNGGGGYPVLQ
ncbi:MAG: hypothetical protein LBT01_00210 [Spirochaetaceae bacterium]|nr:hypothetical protein [Spirochaetaceae bacterium]